MVLSNILARGDNENECDQEKLKQIIDNYSMEAYKSTQRMLEYCVVSETAGAKTLMLLHEQGEKLDRANQRLHNVGSDLDIVDSNLNNLDIGPCNCKKKTQFLFSCCIGLKKKACMCNRIDDLDVLSENNSLSKNISQSHSSSSLRKIINSTKSNSSTSVKPTNFNTVNLSTVTEERIAQNLEHLAHSLNTLKSLAQNVSNELITQNKQIQQIGHHTILTVNQVHDADKIGKRIVSSN